MKYSTVDQQKFGDTAMLILFSLSAGSKHGYAIMADIEKEVGITLGPGTLYGALTKLVEQEYIIRLAGDGRRHPYVITPAGQRALESFIKRWSAVMDTGKRRLANA